MRQRTLVRVWLGLAAAMLSGCAAREPVRYYRPALNMSALGTDLEKPDQPFALLIDQHTEGRFACPLAIAKFASQEQTSDGAVTFVALHPNEESYWTEQMRGVLAVQELIFLRPRTIRPEPQSVPALCESAQRLKAPLLLVYAPTDTGPNSAEVIGILYATDTQRALATLRSAARFLDDEDEEASVGRTHGDQRPYDSRYQAQRDFERYTLACLRELIHRDSRSTTTQPHDIWDKPFIERWWIHQR
jgi:hypothetical protein